MKLFSYKPLFGLALIAVCATGFAGPQRFVEKRGVLEFTQQLIVRPIQIDTMMSKNYTLKQIQAVRDGSVSKIKSQIIRYVPATDEYIVRVPIGSNENTYSEQLIATGNYEYVTPNWRCYPVATPNDPRFGEQWHHQRIQSAQAWNLWTGSSTFTTAFVDSGIMKSHPDLKNLLAPGYNSVDRKTEAEGGIIEDINGHGTHVSGCGSAQGNNALGVAGVGWNFRIIHVRCSNSPSGGASLDDILTGARWAADSGAKTVSASFSGVDSPAIGVTGTIIKAKGSQFFYAAGNDNRDLSGFRHADTIVVGSSNEADTKSDFSAFGRGTTLFAPGSNILSTTMDGKWGFSSGTSMATPVANGALALLWSVNPELTVQEATDILFTTCDTIGSPTIFGLGRVNVFKGVSKAAATLAKDTEITSVVTVAGTYSAGNLVSVQDTNLTNSYNVASVNQAGIGAVASASMESSVPTDRGIPTSFGITAKVMTSGTRPTSVLAYMLNRTTNNYDLLGTRGVYGSTIGTLDVRLGRTDVGKYMNSAGQFKMILRSVIPARLGPSSNILMIGHVKGRYTVNPTS